eukprot:scaffold106667_cov31-Tisochrysis_lutea.AAC.1
MTSYSNTKEALRTKRQAIEYRSQPYSYRWDHESRTANLQIARHNDTRDKGRLFASKQKVMPRAVLRTSTRNIHRHIPTHLLAKPGPTWVIAIASETEDRGRDEGKGANDGDTKGGV